MIRVGLTGSIGSGKSTTAKLFAELGCPVWDADAAVHRLYAAGGAAIAPMQAAFPEAIVDGAVSREALKTILTQEPGKLAEIEAIVHPLVAEDREGFIASANGDLVVLDIPLLFETGGDARMDVVVVAYIDPETQKQRVLERGTMTPAQFEMILSKQMPADEKMARADYVILTDTLEHARAQVKDVLSNIRSRIKDA